MLYTALLLSASALGCLAADRFLNMDMGELCAAEPHLEVCRRGGSRSPVETPRQRQYYTQGYQGDVLRDRIYPGLSPKDSGYCHRMRGSFAWTCQPGKSLRLDLVEFCKDFSSICRVPNFHELPGPRLGGSNPRGFGFNNGGSGTGHVDVEGSFNFGIGYVPGLEVDVGWGVDVGPIPGMGESVGVKTGGGVGIGGGASSAPEAYRRGMGRGGWGSIS